MGVKKLLFILTLICSNFIFGQNINFLKSYGNTGYDYGRDIKQTLDTGYIATGSSSSFLSENADAFLLKVDSMGNFKWSYNYGGSGSDWSEKVILTHDSSFTIAGYTNSFGAGGFDFYMVHTNHSGVPIWEKTYGGSDWDKAYSLVQLEDSGFVLVGETYSYGAGGTDMYIVRTDKFGDTLWTQTYGGLADDYAKDVILDGDSIVVVGGTNSFGAGMSDGIILKYHIDGTLGWVKLAGKDRDDYFNSILTNEDYYLLGGSRSYHNAYGCECFNDFWIYKVDKLDYSIIADTSWDGEQVGNDIVNDITINANNDIFYGGSTTSWGSVDISEGKTEAFLGRMAFTYYTDATYVRNVGTMPFTSSGGVNMFILKIDEFNTEPISPLDMGYEDITLSFHSQEALKDIRVFPTLTTNTVYIEGLELLDEVFLINLNGQIIQKNIVNSNLIEISIVDNGMYFIKVVRNGQTFTRKIIKN